VTGKRAGSRGKAPPPEDRAQRLSNAAKTDPGAGASHPFEFFSRLRWLDGRPLMDTIEPYRRVLFEKALYTFGPGGWPRYNRVLSGRGKKNWKTADLTLAALYRFHAWPSPQGNDAFIVANDEEQAGDDLALAKKLYAINPEIDGEVKIYAKEIVRRDEAGRDIGSLKILPAQDVAGLHGKTYLFLGFDEIHGYKTYDLFEALSPDPTRLDVLTWITSYAGIRHVEGVPLYDLMKLGKAGEDERMLFSWYSGNYTTDPDFQAEELTPEQRANPSMASWGNDNYLADQKRRLPAPKYRRLHLNLPGAPDGAAFDADMVSAAIVRGRKKLPPRAGVRYHAFVDMSGGSNCDAVLAIAHNENGRVIVDHVTAQTGEPPFNPRAAVKKFVEAEREYRANRVTGDNFAGQTFQADFAESGIFYAVSEPKRSDIYEQFERLLNAGMVEMPDFQKLEEQLLSLVVKPSGKIDRLAGERDDWANAVAGAVVLAAQDTGTTTMRSEDLGEGEEFVPHTIAGVFAVLWLNDWQQAGITYCAVQRSAQVPMYIIDCQLTHLRPELFGEIAARLDDLAEDIRDRAGAKNPVHVELFVPKGFQPRAYQAVEERFRRHYDRPEWRHVHILTIEDEVPPLLLGDPVKLHHEAWTHAKLGLIRIAVDAFKRTHQLPILGALEGNPADRDCDNPIVMGFWLSAVLRFRRDDESPAPVWGGTRVG
jgi:hypothetical protein